MRFLPASDLALLVELADLPQAMALFRQLTAQPIAGVRELVPAARTVLVHFSPRAISLASLMEALREAAVQVAQLPQGADQALGRLVEIPVRYDGEDLADVAQLLGLSTAQVIARHTAQPYEAAFAGFAPGFVYLSGGANFQLPRRACPRTKVPAGAVALGGNFSAVYPNASPGGWQLIGVTQLPLWDLARAEPAYIQPGFRVQFVDVARQPARQVYLPAVQKNQSNKPLALAEKALAAIEFIKPGLQTIFQDRGRHGMSGWGISASGALDAGAMRQANRMVGNPIHTPVLENVLGQLQLRCTGAVTLALAGAPATLQVHSAQGTVSHPLPHQALALDAGDVLHISAPSAGVRLYLAVRGGWQVAPVLHSCATDTLAQVGPAPVQPGQCIAVGTAVPASDLQSVQLLAEAYMPLPLPRSGETVTLDVVLGPRTDWFTAQALETFTSQTWRVTAQSNRIGMRLHGDQPLARSRGDELPSEGTVVGAIQVPISGQPVLFLADHPLTGGYPVVAALASYHLDFAAQIPVGCGIRFRVVAPFFEHLAP